MVVFLFSLFSLKTHSFTKFWFELIMIIQQGVSDGCVLRPEIRKRFKCYPLIHL